MDTTGYRSLGAQTAVGLVNAVHGCDSAAASGSAIDEAMRPYDFAGPLSDEDRAALRRWSHRLREIFVAPDTEAATAVANRLLARVATRPYVADHDGRGPHLHFAPMDAPLVQRVQACTAMALASLLCDYGMSRMGVCRAAGCDAVYVDVSRNAQRRFCSAACANRTNVAAFRERSRSSPSL